MQAIIQSRYGSSEVLTLAEVERPTISDDEVLVSVAAAGLDRGTWHLMTGTPYLVRLGFGLRRPRNPVPGLDLAGTVVEVGAEVTGFAPGDEVMGIGKGSWAELAAAPASKLLHRPVGLSAEQAAVVPVSGLTAVKAVRDAGQVMHGDQVLVLGASGGVGSYTVQLAKAMGAVVTATCSDTKRDFVRSLGAHHVYDYTHHDIAQITTKYDVIIDIAGRHSLRTLQGALTPHGTLVIVGAEGGGSWFGDFIPRALTAAVLSSVFRQRIKVVVASEKAADLQPLIELMASHQLAPALERTFPLALASDAMRALESGEVRGKVAILVRPIDPKATNPTTALS